MILVFLQYITSNKNNILTMFNIFKKKQNLFPEEKCVLSSLPDEQENNSIITNLSLKDYKYPEKFPYHVSIEMRLEIENDFHNNHDLIDSFDDYFLNIIKENHIGIHFIDRLTFLGGKEYGFIRYFNFYTNNIDTTEKILIDIENDEVFNINLGYKIEFDEDWRYVKNLFGK